MDGTTRRTCPFVHVIRLASNDDVDDELLRWVCEAYELHN